MLTGYTTNFPNDVLWDTGVAYVGANPIGASKGQPQFDPGREIVNIDFDGKHAPLKGIDRIFHGEPSVEFTLLDFGPAAQGAQVAKLEPGSSAADTGTTPNTLTTVTPKTGGTYIASGEYLTDFRLVYERGITAGAGVKKYFAIYFPVALVARYGPVQGGNKETAGIPVRIVGRKDMASGTTADPAYKLEYRESLPT